MSAEPNIRNRVAGAVVLVSLAVIFLPLILDGKKKNQILESYIPDKPKSGEIILVNIDENSQQGSTGTGEPDNSQQENSSSSNSITIPAEEITASEPDSRQSGSESVTENVDDSSSTEKIADTEPDEIKPPTPVPSRNNRPNFDNAAYLVQLGSFSSRENASRLVSTLVSADHRAYYKVGRSNGRTIYRVFAGPYLEKTEAEVAISAMIQLADVKPIVVTYDPIKHAQG